MIVLSGVQFNAISVMNSSSLMTRGERSILNFDPRCFCSLRVLCSRVFIMGDVPKRNGALPESGRPYNIRIFHRRFS